MEIKLSKSFMRDKYRWYRTVSKTPEKDIAVCKLLIQSEYYKRADTIYTYYSVNYETDTRRIIRIALGDGKKVALPKCIDSDGIMEFYFIEDTDESLVDGAYSLKEPDVSVCEKAFDTENSLCIVPGIAFDKSGCRLGYGRGYYDRFLVGFKGKTVGLCYEECFCDILPREEHDVGVDIVITDKIIRELR